MIMLYLYPKWVTMSLNYKEMTVANCLVGSPFMEPNEFRVCSNARSLKASKQRP